MDEVGVMANADWILIVGSLALIAIGIFVFGRGTSSKGPFGLDLWSGTAFGAFTLSTGIGLFFAWLSLNTDSGMIEALSYPEFYGLVAGVFLTVAVLSGSQFSDNGPVPGWAKNIAGVIGFGILFASGLTISVTALYNTSFVGEFMGVSMPLFPMDAYLATIWSAVLLGLAGAALKGLIGDAKDLSTR